MSKHEIFITTYDDKLAVKLFKFLEEYPEKVEGTIVTICEDGTKELLDKVVDSAHEIASRRRSNLSKALNVIKDSAIVLPGKTAEEVWKADSDDSAMEEQFADSVAEFDKQVQEHPEDFNL